MIICFFLVYNDISIKGYDLHCLHNVTQLSESVIWPERCESRGAFHINDRAKVCCYSNSGFPGFRDHWAHHMIGMV